MKLLNTVFIALFMSACSCSSMPVKIKPDYSGVDPKAKSLYDEYMWLSKQNHIKFYNKVTVGFKKINHGEVIGLCTWGGFFREIDFDTSYWKDSTSMSKSALVFHEMTHCFCGRAHDYGEGKEKKYPEDLSSRISNAMEWIRNGGEKPGYWDDGCPISLMYPVIVDDECMKEHYSQYTKEMFDRCEPW